MFSEGFEDLFFPSLQTLRHIHLWFSVNELNPVIPLVREFVSISGKNIIESIKLSVNVSVAMRVSFARSDVWGVLDQVFTQSGSGWKNLRLFSLHVGVRRGWHDDSNSADDWVQKLRKLLVTLLKGLASNDDIVLDLDVFVGCSF